jgi:hypothetical protein
VDQLLLSVIVDLRSVAIWRCRCNVPTTNRHRHWQQSSQWTTRILLLLGYLNIRGYYLPWLCILS